MRREESDFAGTVLFASSDLASCADGALSTVPTVCGVMALTRGPDASAGLESWAAVKHVATIRLADLREVEPQKERLVRNTQQFVDGHAAMIDRKDSFDPRFYDPLAPEALSP